MDLSNWTCMDCRHDFRPTDPEAASNPCPECDSDLTFAVVPVTEIH